jgi:hypothetical protein
LQCSEHSFILLSDAQKAYDAHLKCHNDGNEKRAWNKLRNSKLLETRLKEANYELRVMGKYEAAKMDKRAEGVEEQQELLSQPGAAAAAASSPVAARGRGESAFLILRRRWALRSDAAEQAAAVSRAANIMDGGLPSTDGAFITRQLAAMFGALRGNFTTWNDEQFPNVGGALSKLVYWLALERKRDLNPAAVGEKEAEEYRPPPPLQINIPRRERAPRKKAKRSDTSHLQQFS